MEVYVLCGKKKHLLDYKFSLRFLFYEIPYNQEVNNRYFSRIKK